MYGDISPYVVARRYHIGTGMPQASTVVVAACGAPVLMSLNVVSSQYHTGSVTPQAATVVVAACGVLLPINASLWLESKTGTQLVPARHKPLTLQ
jgi:uncharacterized protein YaiE (UPF0345 family)